jgi:signal transduction histidine kinase
VGQLLNSAIHEITNKLGGLEYQIESLQKEFRELARWPKKAEDASFLRGLEQNVERMAEAQKQAVELRNQYLSLTAGDVPRLVHLKELAEEIIWVLRPEAQQSNIFLGLKSLQDVPPIWARPSQLRQILLNLILNAIQQMAELKRRGHIMIDISYLPEASLPVRVRVVDEGPGIHRQLWDHIFDFGFTTKKAGVGLGLTVSRQVATSLGGRLTVEESHILWGTSFLLELPKGVQNG